MLAESPVIVVGFEVTATNVPEPVVNPVDPYSTFQAVSVPLLVHPKSTVVVVVLLVTNELGSAHAGHALTPVTLEGVEEPAPWSTIKTPF